METPDVQIRPFKSSDAAACAQLLYDSVHQLAGHYYTPAQRIAWAPKVQSAAALCERLSGQTVFVAEDHLGIAGFMSFKPPEELDFAYVRPNCAGRGVAFQLYDALLGFVRSSEVSYMFTFASELARRFFEKHGWQVEERRDFERNGVPIYNYRMSLHL